MKKLLFAGIAAFALVGTAVAADLPRKMPVKAPPPAPVWSWTGFYIGGYRATSIGHSEATTSATTGTAEVNDLGFSVGGTLGYNWQFSPAGLLGIEGDIGYLGTDRDFQDINDVTTWVGVKSTWYSTLRARLGYVTGPSLLYVTGGGAWARLEETFGGNGAVAPTTVKTTENGWTAGVGIETKLSRSWTSKTEYLYVDLGSNSFTATTSVGVQTATFDNSFHVIKSGLNYKFGEPLELPFLLAPLSSPQRWAGLYAGVNVGAGLSNVQVPSQSLIGGGGEVDLNGTGFTGGAQVGYNWLIFSKWIVGLEGDINYLGMSRSTADWFNTGIHGTIVQPGYDTDWYGTVRARVGTSTGPALLYWTGGFAAVKVENSVVLPTGTFATSGTRAGWTIGGGIETELTPNLSARLESLYIATGTETLNTPTGAMDFKNNFTVVRAGLNWKFGGPSVVSARY